MQNSLNKQATLFENALDALLPQGIFWEKEYCPFQDEKEALFLSWSSSCRMFEIFLEQKLSENQSHFKKGLAKLILLESGESSVDEHQEWSSPFTILKSIKKPFKEVWHFGKPLGKPLVSLGWMYIFDIFLDKKASFEEKNKIKDEVEKSKLASFLVRFYEI